MDEIKRLLPLWEHFKAKEIEAQTQRRKIEDALTEKLELDLQLNETRDLGFVKVRTQFAYKIDADHAQEIAIEHGLEDALKHLLVIKATLDVKAYKSISAEMKNIFSPAITIKPNRPYFFKTKEKNE